MNTQAIVTSKTFKKSEIKKRINKYIRERYNERSIINRLFK